MFCLQCEGYLQGWRSAVAALLFMSIGATEGFAGASGSELDLEFFEDDDCLEVPETELLLQMMNEMSELLEQVLYAGEHQAGAWEVFERWSGEHKHSMLRLSSHVFNRPYCESGRLAWMAAQCLLLMRQGSGASDDVATCAASLDEDFLEQMTPRSNTYTTRLHLVLRSPWPAFRLLDLMVRLYPENGSSRMGACKRFQKWNNDPDIFDWPHFKPLVTNAFDNVAANPSFVELRPEDGPLSRQYRARWLRVYSAPGVRQAIAYSDDVIDGYREHHYRAGCHLGVITAYVLQVLQHTLRDIEGGMQRLAASVANLFNMYAQFSHAMKSDWPLFRVLHTVGLQQRTPPSELWQKTEEPRAPPDAAKVMCAAVKSAVAEELAASAGDRKPTMLLETVVFVTAAWGAMSQFAGRVLSRWNALLGSTTKGQGGGRAPPLLLFLAHDKEAQRQCADAAKAKGSPVRCIEAYRRLGVDTVVAKYLALAAAAHAGVPAVWLDLDVFVIRDPRRMVLDALEAPEKPELVFAKHLGSESLMPAMVAARPSAEACDLLLKYASWLRENPFLLDHQGWDAFLDYGMGDFAGMVDYKGRNVTVKNDRGPQHTFLPQSGVAPHGTSYATFGHEFGSGDGWRGEADALTLWHFWGADESQEQLFNIFYPAKSEGVPDKAVEVVRSYLRQPSSAPRLAALLGNPAVKGNRGGGRPLHFVSVSYAAGCCEQALRKNRRQAQLVGIDDARAFGKEHLDPSWAAKHEATLSQKPGGGWWLWKPHVILKTLKDPSLPWGRGVVVWVDAGNYLHADPRDLAATALRDSDVSAIRLKWCLEADWTSKLTFERMNMTNRYAVVDRPQLGAYFLLFRKTQKSIDFVEEWLRVSEDPEALLGTPESRTRDDAAINSDVEIPGFQKQMADQSVFSILFKQYGFRSITLQDGHKVVTLARWRK
eukprot:TRINITY_DN51104_c0_g1_i1.p1 TRINITY_DN51104_c0_g1~~TRINITY_DN51104_c0_g1_i1.p1  ORF type:complete len:936 (+),score=211.94 TRINITY_DN51104_c0_g1_i1:87-2894(+)